LKGDVRKIGQPVRKLLALIRLPEKLRIVEARAQHALVATPDQAVGVAVGVGHGEKAVG